MAKQKLFFVFQGPQRRCQTFQVTARTAIGGTAVRPGGPLFKADEPEATTGGSIGKTRYLKAAIPHR